MIVSISDNINYPKVERKLFLKKNCGDLVNIEFKPIIARERLRKLFAKDRSIC